MASEFDRLVNQADKAVHGMGGLLSLLLAVKRHNLASVSWDPVALQFILDGKHISSTTVRKELSTLENKLVAKINQYNSDLFSHKIAIDEWKKKMAALVENNHILFGALAIGGIVASVSSDTVKRKISRDLSALDNWQLAIKNKQMPSLGLMINRGRAYLRSAYVTYQVIDHNLHILQGMVEAKRILTPAEHCHTDKFGNEGCWEVAAKGWIDIREMPPIGSLLCAQFCKCYMIYR